MMRVIATSFELVLSFLCIFTVLGCESKFAESSPESVKLKGLSLDERLVQKNRVDTQIEQVQKSAGRIREVIELYKKIQNPTADVNVYTPIDFLIDASNTLKEQIPQGDQVRLVRFGNFKLPVASLNEECKVIDTSLATSPIFPTSSADDGSDKKAIGERLAYSIRGCGSQGQYLPVIEVDFIDSAIEIKIKRENLKIVFQDLAKSHAEKQTACIVIQDEKKVLESFSCENFDVKLSASEVARINKIGFNNRGDLRFYALADIYENELMKASFDIQVLSSGQKKIEKTYDVTVAEKNRI